MLRIMGIHFKGKDCYERDFFSPLFVSLSLLCFIFSHLAMSFSLADDFSLLFSLSQKLGS